METNQLKLTDLSKEGQIISVRWLIRRNLTCNPQGNGNRFMRRAAKLQAKNNQPLLDFVRGQIYKHRGWTRLCSILTRSRLNLIQVAALDEDF